MFRPNHMPRLYHEGFARFHNPYPPNFRPPHFYHFQDQAVHRNNDNINEDYWCETCDRSFPTSDLLERHKQQHQKCNIDGCQFIAHPKVITKHIQMQHSSGLYKKIANINNPEDIKKWIEERKKKYPTKMNIEKKAAEMEEKIKRGEKMGLHRNGFGRNDKSGFDAKKRKTYFDHKQQKKQKTTFKSKTLVLPKPVLPNKPQTTLLTAENLQKLKPFAGISSIISELVEDQPEEQPVCDFVIDDDEDVLIKKQVQDNDTEPKICGALSSLICNYESSDENVDSSKIIAAPLIQTSNLKVHSTLNAKTEVNLNQTNNNKSDDDSGPDEVKIEKQTCEKLSEELTTSTETTNLKKNRLQFQPKIKRPPFKRQVPSTLLQKLLQKEIKHERNVVLQCIRHIVKNNFFQNS